MKARGRPNLPARFLSRPPSAAPFGLMRAMSSRNSCAPTVLSPHVILPPSLAKESKNGGKSSTSIHRLRTVNLSNLPELRNVDIERHALHELDLRGCPNLQTVIVHDSEKAVDLKLDYCANLETFAYSKCTEGIQWPDFSLMPNLKAFYCDECNIKNLDLSNVAKKLEQLSCSKNPIARLDLSNYAKLKSLSCEGLPITSLDCSGLDSSRTSRSRAR